MGVLGARDARIGYPAARRSGCKETARSLACLQRRWSKPCLVAGDLGWVPRQIGAVHSSSVEPAQRLMPDCRYAAGSPVLHAIVSCAERRVELVCRGRACMMTRAGGALSLRTVETVYWRAANCPQLRPEWRICDRGSNRTWPFLRRHTACTR